MSVISDLFNALLGRGADELIRVQLREELLGAGAWEWLLLRELVLNHPGSDGPRLLAADWLEDADDVAWAEFIRVQCRLACLLDVYGGDAVTAPDALELEEKLEQLIGPLHETLAAGLIPSRHARCTLPGGGHVAVQGCGITLDYQRGFVERVELSTPAFLEMAAELFKAHPVTAVTLTDKNPVSVVGGSWWWADSCLDPTEPACLARYVPPQLYTFMTGSRDSHGRPRPGVNPADLTFATPSAAYAALSTACVAYGRSFVKVTET